MIDLETLDVKQSAVVISGAAVVFNRREGPIADFYQVFDVESQLRSGRTVSFSTLGWWMRQSEEAKRVFKILERADLKDFLLLLSKMDVKSVWSHGSTFDASILQHAADQFRIDLGWDLK